jgi:hypothetical protein
MPGLVHCTDRSVCRQESRRNSGSAAYEWAVNVRLPAGTPAWPLTGPGRVETVARVGLPMRTLDPVRPVTCDSYREVQIHRHRL